MRPEVNSNRFEISLRSKLSNRCKVTSSLASLSLTSLTLLSCEVKLTSVQFHFGQFDRSEFQIAVSFPRKQ